MITRDEKTKSALCFSESTNSNAIKKSIMSETSIITIVLALFAVGGTLGGVWFGHLLERNNETRKWRRERCFEVYAEVLNSCDMVVFEADKGYCIECGGWEHVKQDEVVLEKVSEMDRALHKALLLLPRDVYRKVFDLVDHCGKQIGSKSMKCPKLSESEWHKIRIVDLAPLFADCQFIARNDLELFSKLHRVKGFKTLNEELSKGTPG